MKKNRSRLSSRDGRPFFAEDDIVGMVVMRSCFIYCKRNK
jgi:hypothetical protein